MPQSFLCDITIDLPKKRFQVLTACLMLYPKGLCENYIKISLIKVPLVAKTSPTMVNLFFKVVNLFTHIERLAAEK